MTLTDLRVLCAALGFTTVVMHGGKLPEKEAAIRATAFGRLIEEFCLASVPEAFEMAEHDRSGDLETSAAEGKFAVVQRMASAFVEIIREEGGCLPHDLAAKGFTYEEIDRHWGMAKALAHVELKITDS